MKDKIIDTLREERMLSPGDRVAVGFSGGADSVCLLHFLAENAAELGITVSAAHVHHGIRGDETDADEAFVRRFCEKRGIPLTVRRVDVPAESARTGESAELCARRLRYGVFDALPADKIATAHTATDAAETLLINLSRGAGLTGLCSIPPVRGRIIRPLLRCSRAETEGYCAENGLRYVTDSTNGLEIYARNRIRLNAVPALREAYPSFEKNCLRCIGLLREDAALLDSYADALFCKAYDPNDRALLTGPLLSAPPPLVRRALARFLHTEGCCEVEERHLRLLASRLTCSGFTLTLPGGKRFAVRDGSLSAVVRNAAAPEELIFPAEVGGSFVFGDTSVTVLRAPVSAAAGVRRGVWAVDAGKTDPMITVRVRRAGDRVSLAARGCSKTLKKLYNELKIPEDKRARLPVLADGRGVICAAAAGPDASRLPDKDTKEILLIALESPVG